MVKGKFKIPVSLVKPFKHNICGTIKKRSEAPKSSVVVQSTKLNILNTCNPTLYTEKPMKRGVLAVIKDPLLTADGKVTLIAMSSVEAARIITSGEGFVGDLVRITPGNSVRPAHLPDLSDLALHPKVFKVFVQWLISKTGGVKGPGSENVLPSIVRDVVDPRSEIPVIKELCLLQEGEHTMELQSYRNDFKLFNVASPLEVTRLVLSTATNTAHNLDGRVATLHVHVTKGDNQGMEMGMGTHTRFMLWNCRDMSREGFLHSLKEEVELHMPDVIVLTETRVSVNMARLILHSLFPYRVSGVSKANKEGGYVIITFRKQPTYMLCCSKSHCYTWAVVS